jgi:hypothetical protein
MIIRIFRLATALLAVAAAHAAPALPIVSGEPALTPKSTVVATVRLPQGAASSAVLSPVSPAELASLRAANARNTTKQRARRLAIGLVRGGASAAPLGWKPVPGGSATQLSMTSPEAGSLRLGIDLQGVPEAVEMVFFGADRARLEGPVKVGAIRDRMSTYWSPVTEGETQTVEFFAPVGVAPPAGTPRIVAASHIFSTPSSRFTKRLQDIGDSGSCNVDIACSPLNANAAFRNASASAAEMVFIDGSFTTLCSGSLLADSDPGTQIPWLYSANHCFDNEDPPYKTPSQLQNVANTLSTLWTFQAASCGAGNPDASWSQVGGGATLAYANVENDVLLVRLNNAPPAGAFFTGWDANPVAAGTAVTAIHHPQGDLKKVSQGTAIGFGAPGVGGGFQSFVEVRWSSGTTEPGSSGGGLWSTNNVQYFLRGGLWGGAALCTNMSGIDNFSRLDQVYPSLAPYIGPSVAPDTDYTDLWWNPNESGWGLNLVQHPTRTMFGVWYTYESDGTRTWYVVPSGSWTSSTTYTGPLYATTGPAYTQSFNPGSVQPRQVGTATFSFSGPNSGTFSYSVDGVAGTKQIQRQPF